MSSEMPKDSKIKNSLNDLAKDTEQLNTIRHRITFLIILFVIFS